MPDNALTVYIEAVAAALAADLVGPTEVRDLSDDNLALAKALAEKRPGNPFAIHPLATGEALSLQLQNAAYVLGLGLTTPARLRDRCLAGRDDADDLMAIVEMRAAKIAAPIAPRPEPRPAVLLNDEGPWSRLDRYGSPSGDPSAAPAAAFRPTLPGFVTSNPAQSCSEGLHDFAPYRNPAIPRTTHRCIRCLKETRFEPADVYYTEGGDWRGPKPF
jgi:hypothetical protein